MSLLSRRSLYVICFACLIGLAFPRAYAAEISGTIRDNVGATQPKAIVILHRQDQKLDRKSKTAADGRYTFSDLQAGEYELSVASTCFKTIQKRVVLKPAASIMLDFGLVLRNRRCAGID